MPICEVNGLRSKGAIIFTEIEGNTTIDEDVHAKLKDLSTHPAMVLQSFMARSQGFAIGGQQSGMASVMDMSSVTDMSARSGDAAAPAAAGSIATERATRSATMVRPLRIRSGWDENRFLGPTVK